STQLRMLSGELRLLEYDVLTTLEPGGTPLGRRLREAFLETEENVAPRAELLLFAADRSQHVEFLIKPALKSGKIVISDRYADATFAYQGAGRGFPTQIINQIIKIATDGLKPDLTLFFDLPVEKAIARTRSDSDSIRTNNRMDTEKSEFYHRVRMAYLELAEKEKKRFRVINADSSIEEIHTKVVEIVTGFLKK
ncbi:MAG: dTMP kinase, partial [Aridibacter sp.]